LQTRAAGVEIDKEIGGLNQFRQRRRSLFGDGTVFAAGTGAGEIETIFGNTITSSKSGFIHSGDKSDTTFQRSAGKFGCQLSDGNHRFKFIAVDAARDEDVWATGTVP
jgi:hypothetical protein